MYTSRFPGTGNKLGGTSLPPKLPLPANAPSPLTHNYGGSAPPYKTPAALASRPTAPTKPKDPTPPKSSIERMLGQLDLAVVDHSSNHHIFNKGASFKQQHGAQIELFDDDSSYSSPARTPSMSSQSSHLETEEQPYISSQFKGQRESAATPWRTASQSRNERASEVAYAYSEDPVRITRPESAISAFESTESFAQIMEALRSKLDPIWKDESPAAPESETEYSHLQTTRPLSSHRKSAVTEEWRTSSAPGFGGDRMSKQSRSELSPEMASVYSKDPIPRPERLSRPERSASDEKWAQRTSNILAQLDEDLQDESLPSPETEHPHLEHMRPSFEGRSYGEQITSVPRSESPKPMSEQEPLVRPATHEHARAYASPLSSSQPPTRTEEPVPSITVNEVPPVADTRKSKKGKKEKKKKDKDCIIC